MVAGWKRAFYTSKDKESKVLGESHHHHHQHLDLDNINGSPKFTFSSTPPTSPNLHCRTFDSPLSDNKSNNSPKWSTPNSPSSYYSLLKATLRLSKVSKHIHTHLYSYFKISSAVAITVTETITGIAIADDI
jgi:hypothetical protein